LPEVFDSSKNSGIQLIDSQLQTCFFFFFSFFFSVLFVNGGQLVDIITYAGEAVVCRQACFQLGIALPLSS
jgi:hypothetical protein